MKNSSIDSANNVGLPQTFVVFYSVSGNLTSAVTDAQGKFKADFKHADTYMIRAQKIGYEFPAKNTPSTVAHPYVPATSFPFAEGEDSDKVDITLVLDEKTPEEQTPVEKVYVPASKAYSKTYPTLLGFTSVFSVVALILSPSFITGAVVAGAGAFLLKFFLKKK